MEIKRLKLSGFKSFVDPAELRIERGLTGIVGPNGCGKSNLLEAIRWVMGEGSAKSLRGGAMDDVIFAGTAQRPSRDFAEVSILAETSAANDFDDAGRDVEVVRRIERGTGSAYRINGRDVRAKDVALVFADAATGAHSPALVSQGRIGAIIAAKPAERRAMLEEAAGIAGLHVRRKDAEQKLRATESNLQRLDEVLADMELRAGMLKRQARAAERYRKLTDDIRVAEARMIFSRWRDASDAADRARAEAGQAEAAVSAAAEAQRAAAAHQSSAATRLAELRIAAQATRDAANAAGHKLAALVAQRGELDRRIAALGDQTQRLISDREREGQLANDAADALARLAAENESLAARVAGAEAQRPELITRTAAAESAVRDAEVTLAQALAAQAREQAGVQVAEAALAASRVRLDRAERERARVDDEISILDDDAALIAEKDEAASAREAAQTAAAAATSAIGAAEAERAAATADRDAAESATSRARAVLAALDSEARALTQALDRVAGDRAIDAIRVGPGFERALAAALGDDLEAGIGDPRQGWSGVALTDDDPALPAGYARLADHVDAPVELARRLAQVAVVDRDDGARLAVGQRLVTRDGQLRRWDGFVSTGQGAAAAERMERANRLSQIGQEIGPASAALQQAQAELRDANAGAEEAAAAVARSRQLLSAAEADVRGLQRREDQAEVAIERLAGRRAELADRAQRARANQVEAITERDNAEAVRAALPDSSATAELVAHLQVVSEAARTALAQIRSEAATLDAGIAADRERLIVAKAEARSWTARAGEAATRISEMEKRAKVAEAEALALAEAPARVTAQLVAAESESATLAIAAVDAAADERAGEAALLAQEANTAELAEALAAARELRAGAVARAENQELRRIEMGRVSGERFECPPPLLPERAGFEAVTVRDPAEESSRHERLALDRERLGPVNLVAESELAEIEQTRGVSIAERDELAQAIGRLRGSIGSLNREGRTRLLAAFEAVNGHFQRLFVTLFNGGQAHLALIDSDDPLEAGLEIFAQPPGKRLQSLTLLSGGEQALTAVALIFALFLTNPAPICVLDEVDAPLDDANIERFCDLLDAMTAETTTRYLIVTHNAVTMSRMRRLFGVTMIEQGVSRLVSVDLGGAETLLAAE